MREMTFTQESYNSIVDTVGKFPVETGGILLGNRDDFVVQKFIFDKSGSRTSASYDPDIKSLNMIIKKEWEENGLALIGFVHSHPRGLSRLSGDWGNNTGDIGYIKAIFKAISGLDQFLVPIVHSTNDSGRFKLFPYVAKRGREEQYEKLFINIIDSYVTHKEHKKRGLFGISSVSKLREEQRIENKQKSGQGYSSVNNVRKIKKSNIEVLNIEEKKLEEFKNILKTKTLQSEPIKLKDVNELKRRDTLHIPKEQQKSHENSSTYSNQEDVVHSIIVDMKIFKELSEKMKRMEERIDNKYRILNRIKGKSYV